jgi:hypothetical protein
MKAIDEARAAVPLVSNVSEKLGRAMDASLDRMLEFVCRDARGREPWEQRLIKEAADSVLKLGVRVREVDLHQQESESLVEYRAAVAEFEAQEARRNPKAKRKEDVD